MQQMPSATYHISGLCMAYMSIAGCFWVLDRLRTCQGGQLLRQRIFPRLLASLVLADLISHTGNVISLTMLVAGVSFPDGRTPFCDVSLFWIHGFRFVSVLQEVHIALFWTFQAYKQPMSMTLSSAWVALNWFFGLLIGLLGESLEPWTFSARASSCVPAIGHDYSSVVVLATSCMFCCLTYLLVVTRSYHRAPRSVLSRAIRRSAIYPANFLLSYFLMVVMYLQPSLFNNFAFVVVAETLQCSNGLLNAVAYACQGRYSVMKPAAAPSRATHIDCFLDMTIPTQPEADAGTFRSVDVFRSDAGGGSSFTVEVGGAEIIEYSVSRNVLIPDTPMQAY